MRFIGSFFRNYFDLLIVMALIGLVGAFTYMFWPNGGPVACVDDQGAVVACESTDDAGNPVSLTPTVCVNADNQTISCLYHNARKFIGDFGVPLGAVFSWLVYFFIGEPRRLREILFKNDDISAILPMSGRSLRKNTILILGLGRCGKTELIKTLSYGSVKIEEAVTEKWAVYGFGVESYDLTNKTAKKHMLFINDYRGQKGGQLVAEMQNADGQPAGYSGHTVNSVILMVDLFPWADSGDEDKKYEAIDASRVEEHLREWPRNALDGYFGFLRKGSLKQVFLFINKLDQLQNGAVQDDKVQAAMEAFNDLHEDLKRRAEVNGAEFQCIVGSVRTGQGVLGDNSLVEALVDKSMEIDAKTIGVAV